jgi:MFS family permease
MAQIASDAAATDEEAPALDGRRWLTLGVVLGGALLVIAAASVVNLAIPAIRRTLGASFGEIQFVIAGYILVYAIFLVGGGRLGDIYGRKRVFMVGVTLFTMAAAAGGLAPNTGTLIVARMFQGLGAALMYPQFLSIIQETFESPAERNLALGMFGAVIGVGFVLGLLLGGVLISLNIGGATWRPAFLVLVPIGVASLLGAWLALPNRRAEAGSGMDPAGLVGLAAVLGLFIFPLLAGRDAGWPAWMVVMLVACVPVAAAFLWTERRVAAGGATPLLDPALFRQASFAVGCLIGVAFMAMFAGFIFVASVALQVGLGYSPVQVGLALAPDGLAFFAASLLASRLVNGLGRHVLSLGYVIVALGLLTILVAVRSPGGAVSLWALVPGLLVMGLGQGLGMVPLIGTVLSGVRREAIGMAAGALPTAFQVGQVLGIALVGLGFFTALAAQPAGMPASARYMAAFADVLPPLVVLAGLCFLLVFALPRPTGPHDNVLLERVPNRLAGLVYSFYFTTGGHVGTRALAEMVRHTAGHRTQYVQSAPNDPGEFLVHYFERTAGDTAWYRYLVEEALALGAGPVPLEEERRPVIELQVEEIRRRQSEGLIADEFDPRALRLLGFALVSYPRLMPQIARMTTGHAPDSEEFRELWRHLLLQIGARLTPRGPGES